MKFTRTTLLKVGIFTLLLASIILAFAGTPGGNKSDEERLQIIANLVLDGIEKNHFTKLDLNDEMSKNAFGQYLKGLDYNKRFLLKKDVEQLNEYEFKLDDALENNDFGFFLKSVEMIEKRNKEAQKYYEEILAEPFDLTIDENFQSDPEKLGYAENKKDLKERWRKALKFQVVTRVYTDLETQEDADENDTTITIKSIEELEAGARKRVLKSHENWFSRMEKLKLEDRFTLYLNSALSVVDPHTVYYPPKDKENFDIAMSGKLEGIGAQLQEKDGYIKVTRIVPGSASWKQGELEKNDIILKVGQGDEEPVDVVDMRLDDAVQLIRGPKGTEVRLTVKKIDGEIKIIPIIRDVVILEETYAKSALVEEETSDARIGYIKLPKFYADFSDPNGRNCSDDVAKELTKLKEENVDGVVLDLRDNGGGSLQDVVDMVGLFIPQGPVVQVKARYGHPYVLSDTDSDVLYDGPLVVLVNQFSASASEILAAAVQDYERAIVIGSEQTHGKGTVQRFYNLDEVAPSIESDYKPLGSLKLTTQKFYRIDGRSTQLVGMEPDIVLPTRYSHVEIGERELDFPLPWSEIDPVDYKLWDKYASLNMSAIKKTSASRVKTNETFELIEDNADRIKRQRNDTEYPLNFDAYKKEQDELEAEGERYKDIQKEIEAMGVSMLKADKETIEADESKKARTEEWFENIQKDAYIYEALCVLREVKMMAKQ